MADFHDQVAKPVTFVGTLPPPLTGLTAMTQVVVRALAEEGPVKCINWSVGRSLKGRRWKIARFGGFMKSIVALTFRGRRVGEPLYYPANSSWGMIYDIALLSLGRILGYRIVLHHHSYSYLKSYDWRMGTIVKLVGATGAHAVHCQKMVNDFQRVYPSTSQFLIVPPTIVSTESARPKRELAGTGAADRPFILGFLSNITRTKGIRLVLETFEAICERDNKVRLILAGPCMEREVRELVDSALARWPGRVEYRGAVYDEQKSSFFSDIDVFLFPTQYKNESWGIVLTEALATGCPVIATDRGCISHVVQGGCGCVVSEAGDYVQEAVRLCEQWIMDRDSYQHAQGAAVERSKQLEREAAQQFPVFIQQVRSGNLGQPVLMRRQ